MSKSNLERIVVKRLAALSRLEILQNTRPDWLIGGRGERLELDFYLPQLAIAIEVQGEQHAKYVAHFHGSYEGFQDQQRRDKDKCKICKRAGLDLIEIWSTSEVDEVIKRIDREYRTWLTIPLSRNSAYRLLFTHMVAIHNKPERAVQEQRQHLINLIATEWSIPLSDVVLFFQPQHKALRKQIIQNLNKGHTKIRHGNALKDMALKLSFPTDKAWLVPVILGSEK